MKVFHKALLLGLVMGASAIAAPTIASAGVFVDINVAPPPIRVETLPPPRSVLCGRRDSGNGAMARTSGFPGAIFASAGATAGSRSLGSAR